jgi:hypothetical protein
MTEAHASGEIHEFGVEDLRSLRTKPQPICTCNARPLKGWRARCLSAALRRSVGPAGQGRPVVRTWGQFDYRHKNCCTNIVMSIAVTNRSSEIWVTKAAGVAPVRTDECAFSVADDARSKFPDCAPFVLAPRASALAPLRLLGQEFSSSSASLVPFRPVQSIRGERRA